MYGTLGASNSDKDSQEINFDSEREPLLSNKNQNPARPRTSRMTGSKTPGLTESVQDFKAREDRDPEKLNDDVRISFHEIIAEPEGYHSSKYIWHLSNEVYVFCKDFFYQILSLICGIPMAAFWGLIFAFIACAHVWIYSPLKRSHMIKMGCMAEFWSVILKVVFNPLFDSCGKILSQVNIEKKVVREDFRYDV